MASEAEAVQRHQSFRGISTVRLLGRNLAPLKGAAESVSLCCESVEMLQCASRGLVAAAELHARIMQNVREFPVLHGPECYQF